MADNTTQVTEDLNNAVNNALGVGALAAIYTGNFVSFGAIKEGGEDVILVPLVITENGNYLPSDYNANGFSNVIANIPSSVPPDLAAVITFFLADEYQSPITIEAAEAAGFTTIFNSISQGRLTSYTVENIDLSEITYFVTVGIYYTEVSSRYNTSLLYKDKTVGDSITAEMKDRNRSYRTVITIGENNTISMQYGGSSANFYLFGV